MIYVTPDTRGEPRTTETVYTVFGFRLGIVIGPHVPPAGALPLIVTAMPPAVGVAVILHKIGAQPGSAL